jgi:hypothetical protein
MYSRLKVYLEVGARRTFACSLDWPGWCRSGRGEAAALEALEEYAPRYAPVAKTAGLALPRRIAFEVVERLPGTATTDFGAPGEVPKADGKPLTRRQAERLADLVEASWKALDRVAARAPARLRKGPRGGGRDRDAIVQHVLDAETAYARKIGVRVGQPDLRPAVLDALRSRAEPERGWPLRYAARRIAWHALDHAWEMEDRG